MRVSQYDVEKILGSADALVGEVIAETERIVNTPTRDWTVYSRKATMQALRVRAIEASARFSQWVEQGIWIKNMGKICGSLDAIRSDAHFASLVDSRTNGRAHLAKDLSRLIEVFGDGCAYEAPLQIEQRNPDPASSLPEMLPKKSKLIADPGDRPYSIQDLAVLHNVSRSTVTRLYENEPGVLVLQTSRERQRKIGRRYRTIRVPRNVYLRVRRRLEIK